MSRKASLPPQHKALLIVLFVPSVDREERSIDQEGWTRKSLEFLARLFGGATAFPRAQGVWRDDERGGRLVWDEPVIVHCYASEVDLKARAAQLAIGSSVERWAARPTREKSASSSTVSTTQFLRSDQ